MWLRQVEQKAAGVAQRQLANGRGSSVAAGGSEAR